MNPDGTEGFGHVEEICAGEHLFAEIPGYSFNEPAQLQLRAMSVPEGKLLVFRQAVEELRFELASLVGRDCLWTRKACYPARDQGT